MIPAACLALLPATVHGKLPELDAIYYGKVRHNGGVLLSPSAAGQMVVKATLNGVLIAQTTMGLLSSDYELKIPLDDGLEPRLTGTARFNERVHIFVRNTTTSAEYETTESTGLGLSISAIKGDVTRQDISVTGDLGGDTTSAGYNAWAGGYPLMPQGFTHANEDFDGDGSTNLQEFTAGTDPTLANDRFEILQRHLQHAAEVLPALKPKRIHPHSLRHSTAIYLLKSGVDLSTIAHWLGHSCINTTHQYLSIDLEAKRAAIAKAKPITSKTFKSTTWKADEDLLKWLESL